MKNKILIFGKKNYPEFNLTLLQRDSPKPSSQHYYQLSPIQIP